MGIRTKIMLGFIILASMLFISGAISIFELTKLGRAVKGLILENYRSIDYSRRMLDALEQQENALLIFAAGDVDNARRQYNGAHQSFLVNMDSASFNLTLKDELLFIDTIRLRYNQFSFSAQKVFEQNGFTLNDYLEQIYPKVKITSESVKNLITVNQKGLFKSAAFLETSAQRATMPGLIVIVTSLIFILVFTYLVHHYFVSPIIRLTKGINDFVKYRKSFEVLIESKDELSSLKESIVGLIAMLKTYVKKPD
jgi:methyl-accepting chemotaxis protein